MKIIADSAIPFLRGVLEPFAEVEYLPGTAISAADVRNADALVIRTRTRCDEKLLADSRVKLIATATIGFDHIDTAWCAAHGIEVTTAAGCNARGVLQWVGAALVHLSRTQGWQPAERTLGIVGVGHVGSLVKAYAEGWGFRVVCCDPPREERERCGFRTLEEVAREADILTFHTPLDASTRHMADSRLFGLMKPGAILINSSRGGGGRRRGPAPERSRLGARRLGARTAPRSGAAGKRAARHTPHRGLLRAGQGQRHGNVRRLAGPPFRPAARRVVSATGRPGAPAADLLAGTLPDHRRGVRHRVRKPQPQGAARGFRIHARPLRLPPRIFFSTNGADCARSGVRKRRNLLFISEFALF